jgi:hypothetical protein
MTHPKETELALYAGGEAGLWRRWRVARHLKGCHDCRRLVEEHQAIRQWTREQGELPAELGWPQLAAEMKANIRLGLAAGECVGGALEAAAPKWWRPALVAPVLLVIVLGWWLQSWHAPQVAVVSSPAPAGLVVRANLGWIEVEQNGRALALLHPEAAEVTVSASGEGAGARYVDSRTGYVTISHVYTQ